jgi:hypothetical protein
MSLDYLTSLVVDTIISVCISTLPIPPIVQPTSTPTPTQEITPNEPTNPTQSNQLQENPTTQRSSINPS